MTSCRARLWDAARTSVGKKYSLEALTAELLEGQHKRSIKGRSSSLSAVWLKRCVTDFYAAHQKSSGVTK